MFRSLILNTLTINTNTLFRLPEWSDHKWTSTGVKGTKTHWQHIWETITQTAFAGRLTTLFQQHAQKLVLDHNEGQPTHLTSSLKEAATATVVYRPPDDHLVRCIVNVVFGLSQLSKSCLWTPLVQAKVDTETFCPPIFRYYDTRQQRKSA